MASSILSAIAGGLEPPKIATTQQRQALKLQQQQQQSLADERAALAQEARAKADAEQRKAQQQERDSQILVDAHLASGGDDNKLLQGLQGASPQAYEAVAKGIFERNRAINEANTGQREQLKAKNGALLDIFDSAARTAKESPDLFPQAAQLAAERAVKEGYAKPEDFAVPEAQQPEWWALHANALRSEATAIAQAEARQKLREATSKANVATATEGNQIAEAGSKATTAANQAITTKPNTAGLTPNQQAELDSKRVVEPSITEDKLAYQAVRGKQPGATPEEVAAGQVAEATLLRLRQEKLATRAPNENGELNRLDRETARFAKPHEKALVDSQNQLEKIADARAMINGPAESQALGIPKVLTALVSGQGSGVRITQPELNSIAHARGIVGDVEGFLNSVTGQGKLTDTQKKQLTQILDDVKERISQKRQIANDALDAINSARSRDEIAQIDSRTRKKLSDLESSPAASGGGLPKVGDTFQGGKILKVEKIQ